VENTLCSGFCLFKPNTESDEGGGREIGNPTKEVKYALDEYIDTEDTTYDGSWWIQWWYLPSGSTEYRLEGERIPDFTDMNEAAVRLSNKVIRREFVAEVIGVIDKKLDELIKK